jgi:hypothetical protein
MSDLPTVVSEVINATNAADMGRFLAAFASDGFVKDGGRVFTGRSSIERWSEGESIGVRQTFSPISVRTDGAHVVVKASVGGGGYNGPATFTFTLTTDGAAIHSMVITG